MALYSTLGLWVQVGGASASLLQGSPTHSELLFSHLLGDVSPGAEGVKVRRSRPLGPYDLHLHGVMTSQQGHDLYQGLMTWTSTRSQPLLGPNGLHLQEVTTSNGA